MLRKFYMGIMILSLGIVTVSCEKETSMEEIMAAPSTTISKDWTLPSLDNLQELNLKQGQLEALPEVEDNFRNLFSNAVDATPCGPTSFAATQNYYLQLLGQDLVPKFGAADANYLLSLYMDLNFYYAYFDRGEQYFGEDGKYTNFMVKRQRQLEKFWNMPNEVRVNGQHTASLDDREKMADIWELVGVGVDSREEAYEIADYYIELNSMSDQLPESPFFAVDGFATSGNLIVIGDGIVRMLAESGVEEEIVWTGILSHEWAHQVQFDNFTQWYPNGANTDPAAATRHTELEADFLSSYFMTHKRGATYNWKRVQGFFELFFNIGDCGFASPGHHGTPTQRLAASYLGYELANSAEVQGKIMSAEQLHAYFMENVNEIL